MNERPNTSYTQGYGAKPAQPRQTQARNKRGARSGKPHLDTHAIIALALSAVLLIFAIIYNANANASLAELRARRAEEAAAYKRLVDRHTVKYRDFIEQYAAENGVHPAYLAAVILRESSYDPQAVSSAGARGLMQLMPDTADWIAGRLKLSNFSFDDAFDPETNIRMGAWYIKYLCDMFEGDPVKIACAYHAGQNNVQLWVMNYSGADGKFTLEDIPMADTKDYAQKVVNAYGIYYQHSYTDL